MSSFKTLTVTLFVAVAFIATATANPISWDSWPFTGGFNITNLLPKPDSNGRYPFSTVIGNNMHVSLGGWSGGQELLYADEKDVHLQADQTEDVLEFSYPQDGATNVKIGQVNLEMNSDETMETRVFIVDGGTYQDHIKLEVHVKRSRDFHYSLKIYGTRS